MYKGQFAKWKWTKYNKSGSRRDGSIRPAKSRATRKKAARFRAALQKLSPTAAEQQHLTPLFQHPALEYLNDEEYQAETALNAYAALISHWSERETPWRTAPFEFGQPGEVASAFVPQTNSILQHVRAAQDHFLHGRPQLGGAMLRRAFLGIEYAVARTLDVEALWDCCLAVPQLVLTMGWTDILTIFARYLHQYAHIKLSAHHPLTTVAASLHALSRWTTTAAETGSNNSNDNDISRSWQLEMYVARAWTLWIDCVTRVRGRHDDVTIHLKRAYVTLVNPRHAMAGDIIRDFGRAVQDSLERRGAPATTGRILELENLLVRMFLPLFTAETARRAEEMLIGVVGRVEGKLLGGDDGNLKGGELARGGKGYVDRYLLFSANYFMASIAEFNGEGAKAVWYRQKSLDSPRDLFWLQTSLLVESTLRAEGNDGEANAIREERAEAQLMLEIIGRKEVIVA